MSPEAPEGSVILFCELKVDQAVKNTHRNYCFVNFFPCSNVRYEQEIFKCSYCIGSYIFIH